jgi:hypothetical protein
MSMPERHTGEAEVNLHSFLTLALDGTEWLTSGRHGSLSLHSILIPYSA